MRLRDYQLTALDQVRQEYRDGRKAPLLVLPTGGGKTAIASEVLKGVHAKGNRGVFLVHRAELLRQSSRALDTIRLPHGLIAPGYTPTRDAIQIASVQTLIRRLDRYESFDFIAVDEAHHATAGTWAKIIAAYPRAKLFGVTATPCRLDGTGLGGMFDSLVEGPTISGLIGRGFLTRPRVYAPPTSADLSKLHMQAGDFSTAEIVEVMDKPSITGDAVEHYRSLADREPAIAFCASVEHAKHVAETFRAAGYAAESIDGTDSDEHREWCIAALATGRLHVLTSCNIISEGTDIPAATVAIMLRPTMSVSLVLQQAGRVLRPVYEHGMPLTTDIERLAAIANGPKPYAIILDHVGNCFRHGLPTDDREWSLEGRQKGKRRSTDPVENIRQCHQCYSVFPAAPVCPDCGAAVQHKAAARLEVKDGLLQEVTEVPVAPLKGEALVQSQLHKIARERGYKSGWVFHVMQARRANRCTGPIDPAGTIRQWRGEEEHADA